jgi:hypothetical protein
MRTTQRKGDIAVTHAIASFTRLGYDVSIPITESAAYDLVIDFDGNLQRLQVRYSSGKEVELRRVHSNSKGYVVKKTRENAYDWLYILNQHGQEYLYKQCFSNRRSIKPTAEFSLLSVMGSHN